MKHCCQASYGNAHRYIGAMKFHVLYGKSVTIEQSYTGKKSRSHSCWALITIP